MTRGLSYSTHSQEHVENIGSGSYCCLCLRASLPDLVTPCVRIRDGLEPIFLHVPAGTQTLLSMADWAGRRVRKQGAFAFAVRPSPSLVRMHRPH